MSVRGTNRFRDLEVRRALKAAQKSGVPFDRVEIDPVTGKISVITAKTGGDTAAETKVTNPFHTAPVYDPALKTRKKRR